MLLQRWKNRIHSLGQIQWSQRVRKPGWTATLKCENLRYFSRENFQRGRVKNWLTAWFRWHIYKTDDRESRTINPFYSHLYPTESEDYCFSPYMSLYSTSRIPGSQIHHICKLKKKKNHLSVFHPLLDLIHNFYFKKRKNLLPTSNCNYNLPFKHSNSKENHAFRGRGNLRHREMWCITNDKIWHATTKAELFWI